MAFKILFENANLLVVDKPAGISIYPEEIISSGKNQIGKITLIEELIKSYPELENVGERPRYGIVHRLDKETSGVLLVAKNNQSLDWLQNQFKENRVSKKYIALITGIIEESEGKVETLIGRSKKDFRKQKVYFEGEPEAKGKREAITEYKVLKRFKDYTLIEVRPKTGRMHQIRVHMAYLHHPIAGDKKYGAKDQLCPDGLTRQFLHSNSLEIEMQDGSKKIFGSELPDDLKKIVENLE